MAACTMITDSIEFSVVKITDEVSFDDLHLEIDPASGALQFDWKPLRQILASNPELTFTHDSQVIDLIAAWYSGLRLSGYRNDAAELFYKQCEALRTFGTSRVFPVPHTP